MPNISEGRNAARVDELVSVVAAVPGVLILNRTSDPDHHRSVLTFAGRADAVVEAGVRLAARSAELIDLAQHSGVHPRVGALDVLPFVPLQGTTLQQCADLAHRAGERIWKEVGIPVYFYGAAARRPERTALENVRRGQFEGLRQAALQDPAYAPDLGGPALHPSAGAVIVGARKILIAFNINLRTTDLAIGRAIARQIRASSGGFPAVKALGLLLASRNLVQVSMNLTDFEQTPLHVVYAAVERLARDYDVSIESSELIGLLPRRALEMSFAYFVKLPHFSAQDVIEEQARPLTFSTEPHAGPFLAGEKIC